MNYFFLAEFNYLLFSGGKNQKCSGLGGYSFRYSVVRFPPFITALRESALVQVILVNRPENFFFFFFGFLGPYLWHMEVPRLRALIGATAAGLHHSRSSIRSEPRLRPTP